MTFKNWYFLRLVTLAEHSATCCYPLVLQEATGVRWHTPTTLGTQTSTHAGSSDSRCAPAATSWGILHRPSASPGGWGLWSSAPERCLQEQALRDTGAWWGQEVQQWVVLVPRSGVLVGMWQKLIDNAGHSKKSKNYCKFITSITLPSLCSSNFLQNTSNVPNNFSKTNCLSKTATTSKEDMPLGEDSVKKPINYKCLSVIRKPPIWPAGQQMARFSSQAHQNCSKNSHLFLWRKVYTEHRCFLEHCDSLICIVGFWQQLHSLEKHDVELLHWSGWPPWAWKVSG